MPKLKQVSRIHKSPLISSTAADDVEHYTEVVAEHWRATLLRSSIASVVAFELLADLLKQGIRGRRQVDAAVWARFGEQALKDAHSP
jgi:hypothetical protein